MPSPVDVHVRACACVGACVGACVSASRTVQHTHNQHATCNGWPPCACQLFRMGRGPTPLREREPPPVVVQRALGPFGQGCAPLRAQRYSMNTRGTQRTSTVLNGCSTVRKCTQFSSAERCKPASHKRRSGFVWRPQGTEPGLSVAMCVAGATQRISETAAASAVSARGAL